MFDNSARERFFNGLPEDTKKVVSGLEKQEPWVVDNSKEVEELLNQVGLSLRQHANIEKLEKLSVSELTMLFYGLSLTRYLSALNQLSEHPAYMKGIVQPLHNDINSADLDNSQRQRVLISRLRSLVQYSVIERTFSKERRERIKQLLNIKDIG